MFYVYILELNNKQLYTGYTSDLKRRLQEHKSAKVSFTSKRLPVNLIHYEAYFFEKDARNREKFFKSSDGKRILKSQLKAYFEHRKGSSG
jgi:putative endonuclease